MNWTSWNQTYARNMTHLVAVAGLTLVAIRITACSPTVLPDSAAFAEVESVTVGDSVTVDASLGAGALSVADSTWAVYKASDDSLLFRIEFGPGGEVERLFDSFVFASEWLGSEIIPDTKSHATDFPGGS